MQIEDPQEKRVKNQAENEQTNTIESDNIELPAFGGRELAESLEMRARRFQCQ